MTLLDELARWRASGAISSVQHAAIAAIVRKERFSVYTELTALLYLGVISCVAGVGWTVYAHFGQLGDTAIRSALTAAFAGAAGYCRRCCISRWRIASTTGLSSRWPCRRWPAGSACGSCISAGCRSRFA